MSNTRKRIADVFNFQGRFLRSAHLERDFQDPNALSGYVATDFVRDCCERLGDGLRTKSGRRAWRITGDYGSGKSSFALLVANALAGVENRLPPELRRVFDFRKLGVPRPAYLPVLVTCSRQSLGMSLLRALQTTISTTYRRGRKSKLADSLAHLLRARVEPNDEQIVAEVLRVNAQIIADCKASGLLIIVDEVGKFLEYAALNPHRQDVFLLQRLAEAASRSSSEPLFVVCLLHQGFSAYADSMNQAAQREWEKVSGRFDEIVFSQPIEQVAHLIASALNVSIQSIPKSIEAELKDAAVEVGKLGWFRSAQSEVLADLATRLYPLHPTVLPALIRIFRRFGQNERSLFSFLLSNEPFGLQAFSDRPIQDDGIYRLSDLFDYVRSNLGHKLAVASYRSHWTLIDSVVECYATDDSLHIRILKTVGLLNLLNDDLIATEDSIVSAVAPRDQNQRREVRRALEKLRSGKRVLYDRGHARGLCLWPHTSVDLEAAYDEARRVIQTPQRVASLIVDYLETRPLVARRHYIETGNLRHFHVQYCPVTALDSLQSSERDDADGIIIIPLVETQAEREIALLFAKQPTVAARPNWLVAVPQPLGNLASLVQEVQRWDWVANNILELNADKYARAEVSLQRQAARAQLEGRIQSQVGLRQFSERTSLTWFNEGRLVRIEGGRELLAELSRICDKTFSQAPRIQNELVNRRSLSSAAAAARMRLIEQMFTHANAELLGMDASKKPPEMSMYLSVLSATGIHHETEGVWRIAEPHHSRDKKHNVLPALRKIRSIVQALPDSRVPITEILSELRRPPFGVRDGMLPILLTVFAIAHQHDVAFYKDGSFLREMTGEHMLVLTKQPDRFDVQYCKIEGVRAELFEKLLNILEVKASPNRPAELLDVVKPLCTFVAQLPSYVHSTKKLSPAARAVRDTILAAREPGPLLFSDLPRACGFEPFSPHSTAHKEILLFVRELKKAHDELRAAFPMLQDRLRAALRTSFESSGSFQQFRSALASRAEQVVVHVKEPKLRAFCLRLLDDSLSAEPEWLESLGSLLALKPPMKWHDAEEDLFTLELNSLANRFHRVESIAFVGGSNRGTGIRLAITQSNGTEHEQVIHVSPEEEQQLNSLQAEFEAILTKNKRLGLAAASRALWKKLEKADISKS